MNRPLRLAESFVGYFVGVGWVFTECSQRVRYLCVTYSPCKSMVFGVQKGGFYIAKVWFLFFECCVVAIRQQHY